MPKEKKDKRVRITLTMPDGTRKYYSGRTKKEAEEKRDKDKLLVGRGVDVCASLKFKQLAEAWMSTYESNVNLHKRTIESTKAVFNSYILPVLGELVVSQIKPINIDKLMSTWAYLSNSTQRKILNYTKNVFVLAVDNDLIPKSPVPIGKKAGGKTAEEVQPLTDAQCEKLLNATVGTRVWLFLMVLRYAGLRKGEAIGLTWNDIDFDHGTLQVNRSIVYTKSNRFGEINPDCKTRAAHRTIPMPNVLTEALRSEREKASSIYVFPMGNGNYMSESSFQRMWGLIKTRSVTSDKKRHFVCMDIDFDVHPHQLRHTYATKLIASGVTPKEAQYLLGHSTEMVTMHIYAHYQAEQELYTTSKKISSIFDTKESNAVYAVR